MARRKTNKAHRDCYQEITDRILAALEKGTVPWQRPWTDAGAQRSFATDKPYLGINQVYLDCVALESGYSSHYWLTFGRAKKEGGHVKKGERGRLVVHYEQRTVIKEDETDPDSNPQVRKYPSLAYDLVWNVDQCVDVEAPDEVDEETPFEPIVSAEKVWSGWADPPKVVENGSRASYRVQADLISLPPRTSFNTPIAFYCTLFHECIHATGHHSRLARHDPGSHSIFGSCDYSKEELVAEFGAAMLSGSCGFDEMIVDSSASYIDHWRQKLSGDKRLVVAAAGQAQKAADYVLGIERTYEKAERT